jgi:hypothetical protein
MARELRESPASHQRVTTVVLISCWGVLYIHGGLLVYMGESIGSNTDHDGMRTILGSNSNVAVYDLRTSRRCWARQLLVCQYIYLDIKTISPFRVEKLECNDARHGRKFADIAVTC